MLMSSGDFPPPTGRPRRPAAPAASLPASVREQPIGAYAAWPQRAGAWLFDSVIATIATVALYAIAIGLLVGGGGLSAAGIILVLAVYLLGPLVAFAFYAWQMCQAADRNGQTIGKRAVGIRVVRADGLPVGFGTVLLRHALIGVFYVITLGVGIIVDYLWPLWDVRSQSLHDKLAKTYVVGAHGTAPAAPWERTASPRLAPPVGESRPVPPRQRRPAPSPLDRAPAVRSIQHGADHVTEPLPATVAYTQPLSERRIATSPGQGAFEPSSANPSRPWLLAGCLLLALVAVGVGFRLVVNRGAQKLSDAITRSSLASANASSTPDSATTASSDSTPTPTITPDPSTTGGYSDGATPSGDTPSGSGTTVPVLSGVTGYIVVRSGPSTSASKLGAVSAGDSVTITCQTHGDTVMRSGNGSDVWDHIAQPDGYVTDTVIDTGSSAVVFPDCDSSTAGSPNTSGSTGGASQSASGPPNGETTRSCDPNVSADTGTSCGLAENTFQAYASAIKSGGTEQTVQATGPVTGRTYTLSCTSPSDTVSCTGGQTIYITFPYHAAEIY